MQATALRLTTTFGIDHLTYDTLAIPDLAPDEVLVAIRAASLNYRDLMLVTGKYDPNVARPRIPCSDGAGEVLATGSAVTRFKPGDRVTASFFPNWTEGPPIYANQSSALGGSVDGTLTTHQLFPEHALLQIPDGLTYAEAATLPCAAVTAWNALVSTANIGPQDTVLLLGTGGVSIFGLQIAKLRGARTILTSSSDAKLDRARQLGADETINYAIHPDWDSEVRRLTSKHGVTHVLEVGGGGTLPLSLRSAAIGAQISIIGVLTGTQQPLDILPILLKSLRVQGIYVGSRHMLQQVAEIFAQTNTGPVIDRTFPFAEAKAAFHHLRAATHFGKLVIEIS